MTGSIIHIRKMVHNKCRLIANQKTPQNLKFNVLFWNAGGLTTTKLLEIEHQISIHNPDLFVVIDAASICEKKRNYQSTSEATK